MKKSVKIVLAFLLVTLTLLLISRHFSPREIDDIHPNRPCESEYIKKADILWVIPFYENISIEKNKTWCKQIISLNKTIGMHGVTHSYHEFIENNITTEQINKSLEAIKECFGKYPTMFKAPYLKISKENKKMINSFNLKLRTPYHQTIHKVYHCSEAGTFPNWLHDLF